jgi:hypothetical protein
MGRTKHTARKKGPLMAKEKGKLPRKRPEFRGPGAKQQERIFIHRKVPELSNQHPHNQTRARRRYETPSR